MIKNNKLDRNNIENFMSLTSLQQGMLFHYISDEESNMYHEQLSLTLIGDLKLELLQKAWKFVIDSNEMLRTIFRWKGIEKPIQVVLKQHEVPIKYLDFTNEEDKEGLIKEVKIEDLNNRIDITKETLKIYLCKLDESTHEMIISNQHILFDGWSNGIILKEVMEAYNCLYEGKEPKKFNKTKFSQFIKYLNTINKEDEKKYWTSYLKGLDDKDDYFCCKEVGVHKEISYKIDDIKANKIKEFSKENKVLLSSILYGAWGVLLQKFSNSKEVLFGTTVSGRPENIGSIDKMVGLFINTIPLRVKSDEKTTLMGLIKSLDENLNDRKGFENTSLIDIKEYCGLKVSEEIFNSIVTIENYPLDLSSNKENILYIEEFSIVEQTNYNMALEILTFDGIEFKFNFNSLSIEENIVEKLGVYLERIIEKLLNNSNIYIENIDLLSEEERNQILYEFNDTKADYPKDKTIHELFEEQVEKTPDNIAVVFEDKKLTYRELNERANSLARVLRDKGVKADSIVGIMVERSLEMIVGIMGILKAGGAYLPIDPNCPKERVSYMLKDSESRILLSKNHLVEDIEFKGCFIDLYYEELFNKDSNNLNKVNKSTNLAYIIYTSGTTGNPKGAMIEHKALVNRLNWMQKKYPISQKDTILQKTTYTFDVSVWEILWWSLVGAKVCMLKPNAEKEPMKIIETINKYEVTTMHFVPSMLDIFLYCVEENRNNVNLSSLKQVFSSGEALNFKQVSKFYKEFEVGKKLINLYGPTEATIDVSYFDCCNDNKKIIPIGKPIDNTELYILKNNELVPIGVLGELYIAGHGLARGYVNRSKLTAEKFIDNPFEPGTKMYKTGDLARWLPDGNIEFLGRIDNQVKIRGFRIELGEIENRLLQHENIKEAAVLVKENKDGEKYICAYIVSDKNIQELDLKGHLKETLPEYMVPAYFVELEKMPLTTNGKLDRRALPEPNLDASLTDYEAPRNEVEETLAKIWSEILGVEKVGINDNFFDLGGHSLKATILMSKIHKELNKEVPLKELFKTPTIKELSKYIENAEENPYSKIEKVEEKEYYEASSAQKRMYMLQQFDKDSVAYNMPAVFELEGEVNRDRIEETFRKLTQRHEALRTYFEILNGEIIQKLQNNCEFKLEHRTENENVKDIINNFVRPFELEQAPLFRVELVENKDKTYLLIDMHHIISDGLSMEILINEFNKIYSGKTLEPLKLQYKDFAAWQNNFLKSEEMKKQEEYWINRFNDEIPVLNMPTDYERPAMQSFEGDSVSFELNEEITLKLRKLTKETGNTMHMALLSAFNILLSKYSGQEDIVIGTPVAGRPHADLQNIMGMFVNTLALRNNPQGDKKFINFLKEVKENSFKAYENQSYQLETLVEKLDVRRDTSRNPLFDVMFNMVDTVTAEGINLEDVSLKLYNNEVKRSKFDLTLNALESDTKINFSMEYCSKLFKKETIERLSSHYVRILDSIVSNKEIKLNEVDLLSEAEKNQILYEFNDTKVDYPKDKTIQELFEEQVERTPDNIAVVFEGEKLTYKELNEKSNSLARLLRDKGVKADSIVGIMVERSLEMIIGIIGILKAGGAYLPIDPSYPKERIEYMLKDSQSKILLSKNHLVEDIEFDGYILNLYDENLFNKGFDNLERINKSTDLAYVIYTSGTTGKPKGAMIEHRALVNRLNWMQKKYPISQKDTILQKTTYTFDVSVWEILWWSLVGAKVCMLTPNAERDPMKIIETIDKYEVTTMHFVPSMLDVFLYCVEENRNNVNLSSLRQVFSSGEALNFKQVSKFYKEFEVGKKLINLYGPTEVTIDVSYFDCSKDNRKTIPIGKPIDNTELYILNNNELVPIGVSGELYISGHGLARGYVNRSELTTEKFVDNPFEPGTKMYKTGDLTRWLPDGNIEFLGRIDNQVKIRGFRIELGEIENGLLQHESVKEAVVLVKENKDSEKYICAYVVSKNSLEKLNLRNYLKETLPEYMIPTYFIQLEKMTLTTNGKLDKSLLPEPNLDAGLTEYEAPRNDTEETLAKIWSKILGVTKVGINDNFFNLGGHSLKAIVLVSKIHKELNKEVPLKELFKSPTIKELSKYIKNAEENLYSKIEKVEEKEYYEASSAQKRMYMLQQFNKDSTAYNMPIVFGLQGKVDKDKIEEAFRKLTERHDALRTYFKTVEDEIVQKIDGDYTFNLENRVELRSIEDVLNDFVKPFDLGKAPLFRVEIVEIQDKKYLLIDMHHIISDGVSMNILTNEFVSLYNGNELESLKLQYKDFAAWQNNFLNSEEMKKQEEYWINRFSDEIQVLNMPIDYERPAMQSFEGDSVSFEVDEDITLKLRRLAKETGTTMHMVLLSVFNILLSKYSGQEDIVIGAPIAGRVHADLQNIMGMFVNTLALRNKPEGDKKYIDFLKEVKENSLKAYENQSYQLEALVEKLDVRRDTSRNPLFDVMFNMVDTATNIVIELNDVILKPYSSENKVSKFDLILNAVEDDTKINFCIEYCSKLFKKETIERLSRHYTKILDIMVNNVEIKLYDIDLLSEEERNQILYKFNDTKADYPKDKTIHELFEEQVEKTPDNIAVVFEDKKLTYRELNERANSLARVLRDKGVKADSIVGIMVERSLEMIVGIMGILKAGGAYLPIDPNYPKERVSYMLKDSNSKILLSENHLLEYIEFDGYILNLYDKNSFDEDFDNLERINKSTDLAYIIYTSGTTGKPKGAMIEHRALVNRLNWMQKKYPISQKDTILQKTTYTFDVSVWEILWWSLVGAKVCMLTPNAEKDLMKIIETIDKYEVTTMHFVPSMLDVFLYCVEENRNNVNLSSLKQVFSSGEALNFKQVSKFYEEFESEKKLINLYGPTEATIDVSYFDCCNNNRKIIPIGKPINNTELYILKNNELVPIGVAGELYIAGHGLARGYVNRSKLTAEKFIDNPFEPETKMYKTGDLVRWLPDGNIEFLGRIDNQVKIRGFRIELGEIESRVLQHGDVKEVVVVAKEDKNNEKYICAYVVSEKSVNELKLKSYLKETLPEYMVPTYFVQLEKMPLTANGKLDRRALPEPNLDANLMEYEAPRNEVEETLAKIWSEILGVEKIGINDNFFALGGHSLKATMLISKVHKELDREVPLKELFKSPTIKELSKYIENAEENLYSKIEKVEEKEYYEASSAQKRMYMLQQFDKDSVSYNMPAVFELEGEVDRDRIEETFRKLTQRHEALRTYFETLHGEIIQKLKNNHEFKLEHRIENANIEDIINNFVRPFDLGKDPLFRVEIVEIEEKTYLLIDMHHIISDGISMNILIQEFIEVYSGKTLEPLKLQYKDFAAWQNNFLKSEEMKMQEEYWINRFSDEIPMLNIPTDYERPAMQSFEGDTVSFEVEEEITSKLRKLTKETGTTMHMALLSALNVLLSKYSGQEDIVVATPIAGRPHADLQNIMGMFVNTLALRNKPEGDKKYIDFLKEVKENSLKAYENQSYQLETLVEKLNIRRDTSRNPLFDVMFNMIDTVTGIDIKLDDIILKPYNNENKVAKFDLTLNALEKGGKLNFTIDYCSKLFKKETIERLSRHYKKILDSIVNNIEIKLGEVDLLSEAEKNHILYDFNDTEADYPKDKTIHELFEEQVKKTPDNIAVVFEDKKLTYRELNERANSLARVLRNKGVKADVIVGIMIDRSLEMIVGIMGILKAGGAYLPIDSNYPKERVSYMLKDSESKILLSKDNLIENIKFYGEIIDLSNEELFLNESSNIKQSSSLNNLAYVIYTSGTTGNPKGAMIEHLNLNNFIRCFNKQFNKGFDSRDIVLSLTNYVFDVSVCELFITLTSGATLVINDKHKTFDPKEISDLIINNNITFSYIPPSLLLDVYDELKLYKNYIKLNKLLVGVEAIRGEILRKFYDLSSDIEIINGYGPTEATICSTFYKINGNENEKKAVPIGKPIGNSKIYILNDYLEVVPVGVRGQIFVSGSNVGRGYLNKPDLTAEKFIDNPFEPGTKMYKTGDLARWLPDGNIEFLGRIDNQVKIRGFRIELGEIENRLLEHENIKEVVVLAKENKESEKYICAYVVSNKNIQELDLKNYLKETLPEYMIPSYFIELEKMPITTNGKLDRKALPEPNLDMVLTEYEAPRNETEETLAKIWSEVLGIEKIGINDNFFDLGGHSLKATILMSKIHKKLDKEVPLKELFKTPTIKELGKYIENAEENPYLKIKKVEEKEYYKASSAQKRMYMTQQLHKESIAYNMPIIFEISGDFNKDKIEESFSKIILRHEALRTYFEIIDGEIVQRTDEEYCFRLASKSKKGDIESIISNFISPFNLEKSPLFRVELIENQQKTYLFIDMHHIISDGISIGILIKEFIDLYNGKKLNDVPLQYKDFAMWQNNILKSEEMKQHEQYWLNLLGDEIPSIDLPYDYERPDVKSMEGDYIKFEIDRNITQNLKRFSKETETTIYMILLSAFNILLSKYSGKQDIVIGTPVAGRQHDDIENVIGVFVNILVLRNYVDNNKKYVDVLQTLKENLLKAYENQSYQFDTLVEKLDKKRNTSKNSLFDVMFNMVESVSNEKLVLGDTSLIEVEISNKISKLDLSLIVEETNDQLKCCFEYCTKLFNKETIEIMAKDYLELLKCIVQDPEAVVSDIKLNSRTYIEEINMDLEDLKEFQLL